MWINMQYFKGGILVKIIPNENICDENNLTPQKQYEVLDIDNDMPGTPDEYYKIINDIGKEIWIDDWDCIEVR